MAVSLLRIPKVCIDESFNYLDFYGIDHFNRMREIVRQKIRRLIWKEHNQEIEKKVRGIVDKGLNITNTAYGKLEHIVSEFGNLTDNIGKPTHELALYLLTDKKAAKGGNPVVDDVYIAKEQEVWPAYCIINGDGAILSCLDIRDNLDKRVAGWGHSHGDINNFFSFEDKKTFDCFLEDHKMFDTIKFEHYEHSHDYNIQYTFGLVTNLKKDNPFAVLNISFPEYKIDDNGDVTCTMKTVRFENIELQIIEDDHYTSNDEKSNKIRDELKTRVSIDGKKLGEYESKHTDIPKEDITSIEKDNIVEKLKKRKIFTKVKQKLDLTARLTNIEEEYSLLKSEYEKLQEKVSYIETYLETLPINKGLSYSDNMQNYYTNLISSKDEGEKLLGIISKIIFGQYHTNFRYINKGNYEEDHSQTRIWKWEDRLKAVRDIYKQNEDIVSGVNKGLKEGLKEILKSNRYLKRKHNDKIEEINKILKISV